MVQKEQGTLYIVPTPIGNLDDITFRAVKVLKSAHFIYAEDTRTSSVLLNHYGIKTPKKSYHKFNERARCREIIDLLIKGNDIAIISDAGTPGISDPSNIIIQQAIKNDIAVCVLPGPTAFVPALVASGFNISIFCMIGFLPHKKKEREKILVSLKELEKPIVLYESPHMLSNLLNDLNDFFPNAQIVIGREISKIHECFYRGFLKDIILDIKTITLKGEFVVVLQPACNTRDESRQILDCYYLYYADKTKSEASKLISERLVINKNIVYNILLNENFYIKKEDI